MEPAEAEFLAEKELVTIVPNFSLDRIHLIGVRRGRAVGSGSGGTSPGRAVGQGRRAVAGLEGRIWGQELRVWGVRAWAD